MEADLLRFYGVDVRDRWHPDRRRRLTLRRIHVLLRHLPHDAATVAAQRDHRPFFALEHVLLADVWQAAAQSKKPHPLLTEAQKQARRQKRQVDPKKLAAARARARARKRSLQGGEG